MNTDAPFFFNTSLSREYLNLHRAFGCGSGQLAGFALSALRASFVPDAQKAALDERCRRQFDELFDETFGTPLEVPPS